jgi:carboxymethylenebutenolidase
MFQDITKPPPLPPHPKFQGIDESLLRLSPLTRRGHGPGIVLLTTDYNTPRDIIEGVPSPLIKWAEEGYTVVEIQQRALNHAKDVAGLLQVAIDALRRDPKCEPKDKIGLVGKSL